MTKTRLVADGANVNSIDGDRLLNESIPNVKLEGDIDGAKVLFSPGINESLIRGVQDKLRDIKSVFDFIPESEHDGIKSASLTYDCTSNIQTAIDSLEEGQSLYFPDGSYLLSLNLAAGTDATFQGDPAYRSLKIQTDRITLFSSGGAKLIIDAEINPGPKGTTIYLSSRSDVTVSGLKILGLSGSKPSAEYISGIEDYQSTRSKYENIEIGFMGGGIRLHACSYSFVRNSYLYDCRDTAFNGFGGCKNCAIEDSIVTTSGDGNCTFYGSNFYCAISRCYFRGSSQLGVIESSHYSTIENCHFDGEDGLSNNGPIMNRCRFSSIKNNRIVGMNYGVIVRETDIPGSGGIPNWAALITGNEIRDCGQPKSNPVIYGMWLDYGSNILVANNTFIRTKDPASLQTNLFSCAEIVFRRGPTTQASRLCENVRIVNNTFMLKHPDVGFGFYSDYHTILSLGGSEPVKRLSFDGNTIIAPQNQTSPRYLLRFGTIPVEHFSFCGNTISDINLSLGPSQIIQGTIKGGTICNNNILFYQANSKVFDLTDSSNIVISSNSFTGSSTSSNYGDVISLDSLCDKIIVTSNSVKDCNYFITSDSTPTNLIVSQNIVDHRPSSPYLNVTPAQSSNNIFTQI